MIELIRTLAKGGVVMVPLLLCSLAALTVIIERYLALRRASADGGRLMTAIRGHCCAGDIQPAIDICDATPGPIAAVLGAGLRGHNQNGGAQRAIEEQALLEIPRLSRRLVVLDTVVTVAPLLGLLGTVIGMISSFHIVALAGASHPTGITAGVAEALIATATGLVIAIFTLVGYNYFQDRIKGMVAEMEIRATQLVNFLAECQERANAPISV